MKMTLEAYLKLEYDIIITPEECTDSSLCYRAEHPQLPGCMSHGSNPEEALRNLKVPQDESYISKILPELKALKEKIDQIISDHLSSITSQKLQNKILQKLQGELFA